MTIKSRWDIPLPTGSLQQWIFGSPRGPLPDGDKTVLFDAERPETRYLTMSEYRLLSKRVALGLIAAGVKPGDRILLFSSNSIWYPTVFLGVLMAGGIFTGANPGLVPRELAFQLKDSGAAFMFASPASLDVALKAAEEAGLPKSRLYVFDADIDAKITTRAQPPGKDGTRHWTELLAAGDVEHAEAWDWIEPADSSITTCCLNYSSGTTGVPKGVEITHSAYVANGEGVVFISGRDSGAEAKKARARGLCFLPLYHAFAQTYFIANFPKAGVPSYIMPSFDFVKMLQHIQTYRITQLTVVPPVVVALAKHPLAKQFDLSSVELIGCGASPLGKETAEEAEKKLWPERSNEVIIRQGWGMTEVTCTCISWDPLVEPRRTTAVGELMPNTAARLVETDGSDRPITEAGKPGELWVSGPTMMKGYWRNPAATAATIVVDPADGRRWLRTGDIAYVEEYKPGTAFHIVDRLKELIKVKGNQVAPAELEALLLEKPDVLDAAVVGVMIKGEELPRAYIVPAPGIEVKPREVAAWFEGKVARFKRLQGGIVLVDAIPKNPSGKILRKILRERAKAEVGDKTPPSSKLS